MVINVPVSQLSMVRMGKESPNGLFNRSTEKEEGKKDKNKQKERCWKPTSWFHLSDGTAVKDVIYYADMLDRVC